VTEGIITRGGNDLLTWQGRPWLFFQGLNDSENGGHILIASPSADDSGRRIVALNDGSARTMLEAEYQRLLKRNKQTEP